MAIAPWTQFDYVAEFDAAGIDVEAIRSSATLRRAAFVIGDAVLLTAQTRDTLNLKCTATGDIGLSIVREGQLVLALGAVAEVPLGAHLSATNGFEGAEAWLEVATRRQASCRLRERESGRVDGYEKGYGQFTQATTSKIPTCPRRGSPTLASRGRR